MQIAPALWRQETYFPMGSCWFFACCALSREEKQMASLQDQTYHWKRAGQDYRKERFGVKADE
eukprot:278225-Pyramimonas_sp.AAC.2